MGVPTTAAKGPLVRTLNRTGLLAMFAIALGLVALRGVPAFSQAASPAPSASVQPEAVVLPSPGPMPTGREGELIGYGREIIEHTQETVGKNVRSGMSCEACHIDAGTKAHAGSLRGIYANFPQYNKRSDHFITLQDRLAECFMYSMNGTPPAYSSHEMIALTAYIAYISRGATIGEGFKGQGYIDFSPDHEPSVSSGAKVYTTRCESCHGADGQGSAAFPPLWGPKSFNGGAGMHRLTTMSAFVRYNMPYGSPPDTLSKQEAYDVSAYVLSHPRPVFQKDRMITFPAQRADTF